MHQNEAYFANVQNVLPHCPTTETKGHFANCFKVEPKYHLLKRIT